MKFLLIIVSSLYLSAMCFRTLHEFFKIKDTDRFALHIIASFISIGALVAAAFNLF